MQRQRRLKISRVKNIGSVLELSGVAFRLVQPIGGFLVRYTMVTPEIRLTEWKKKSQAVCKNKYCFAIFFIRNAADLVKMNSKYLH